MSTKFPVGLVMHGYQIWKFETREDLINADWLMRWIPRGWTH